jgi:hypothetical protein
MDIGDDGMKYASALRILVEGAGFCIAAIAGMTTIRISGSSSFESGIFGLLFGFVMIWLVRGWEAFE